MRESAATALPPETRAQSLRTAVAAGHRESAVLVVGGAGYIGSLVVGRLLAQGYDVIVLDALLYGHGSLTSLEDERGFEMVVSDTRDSATLRRLLPRVGAVVHLGEIVGDPACDLDPLVTRSVNYLATTQLAAMAAESGVTRFVYPSSCSVYGWTRDVVSEDAPTNPVSLYGRLKGEAEQVILSHASKDFQPVVFRLATAYGLSPRPRFDLVVNVLAGRAATEGAIMVQGGGQWRPFVHAADVAALLVRALEAPAAAVSGQIFNAGSNAQNHTIEEVAEIVRARLPEVRVIVSESRDRRDYRVAFDKVEDVLGFMPTRTVADGVAEIVRAIRNNHLEDIGAPRYSNVRALVEAPARERLWRADLGEGDPTRPFRARDAEERPYRRTGRSEYGSEYAETVGS